MTEEINKMYLASDYFEESNSCNLEGFMKYINRKVEYSAEFYSSLKLVLCANQAEFVKSLEKTLEDRGKRLIRIDCREYSTRNHLINAIAASTSFSKWGSFIFSAMHCGYREYDWDYVLMFENCEAFNPADRDDTENIISIRMIATMLKNDYKDNPHIIACFKPTAMMTKMFVQELNYAFRGDAVCLRLVPNEN